MLQKILKLISNLLKFLRANRLNLKGIKKQQQQNISLGIQSEHAVHFQQQQINVRHKVFQIFQVIGIVIKGVLMLLFKVVGFFTRS